MKTKLRPNSPRPCTVCARELKTTRGGRIPPHRPAEGFPSDLDGRCTGSRLFPLDDIRAGTEEDG